MASAALLFNTCRLSILPNQLHILLNVRLLSTTPRRSAGTTHQYPYPSHPRPTPHQIFHLPPGASQQEIKARYYDLVRSHHPDSTLCRSLPPSERHARFQAIRSAYDVLRGKGSGFANTPRDPYYEEVLRRKRFYQAHYNRRAEYANAHPSKPEWTAPSAEDRWKDRVILIAGIIILAAGLAPGLFVLPFRMEERHRSAVMNLSQAKSEAREFGEKRRSELRKRAQDIKDARKEESRDEEDSHR